MRMSHTITCGLPGSTTFFQIVSQMARFSKEKLLDLKCVLWFSLQISSEIFLILNRTEWDMIKNVYLSSCKVPAILVKFKYTFNFLDKFSKILKWNFMDICPVGVKFPCGRTGGQTRKTKVIVAFRNFVNGPKTCYIFIKSQNLLTCLSYCRVSRVIIVGGLVRFYVTRTILMSMVTWTKEWWCA
jgi:hypothetical protein